MAESYYLRFRGMILGPFTEDQVHAMIKRGRVSRSTEASTDQQTWRPLAEWSQFFPAPVTSGISGAPIGADSSGQGSVAGLPPGSSAASPGAQKVFSDTFLAASPQKVWHVAYGKEAQSVTEAELISKIQSGHLTADTLVWSDELSGWEPIIATRLAKFLPKTEQLNAPIAAPIVSPTVSQPTDHQLFSQMAIIAAHQCSTAGRVANVLGIILTALSSLVSLMFVLASISATLRILLFVGLLIDLAILAIPVIGLWASSTFDAVARTRSPAQLVLALNRLKVYWIYLAVVYGGFLLLAILTTFLIIAAGVDIAVFSSLR